MGNFLTPRSSSVVGGVLVVLGVVLVGALLLTTPFTGCTEVGVPNDANTGPEFIGIEDGNIVYSPDGVNECQSPLQVAAIPLVPGLAGLLLLVYNQDDDQPAAGVGAADAP